MARGGLRSRHGAAGGRVTGCDSGFVAGAWWGGGGVRGEHTGSRLCHEGRGGADETDSALLRVSQAGGSGGADGGGIII